jgi:hypothetical protein
MDIGMERQPRDLERSAKPAGVIPMIVNGTH